jgi:peptidyl-prolyl cis-trans isomerase A (cyclophilin A)
MISTGRIEKVVLLALVSLCLTAFADIAASQKSANPVVTMETNMGAITIELFKGKAPKTVDNFLQYVRSGFYNGTIFVRVIKGFVIQGGGYTVNMQAKPTRPPIPNEAKNGLKNMRGTLSMARRDDINSATSQFFINTKDNPSLDHRSDKPIEYGYAVFGKVIAGMDVVDKIESVPTGIKGQLKDVPVKPIVVKEAKIKG